ncbi:hypothetical protein, partial [Endozoicomonas atrinae]|uniref:hypothetical protein n=1 Tax=Endozoicomonas atrinae TaxID=1333660 RepID=UPI001112DDAE
MCGGGGSPAPQPTPEEKYRHQIGAFTSAKRDEYETQASDYNNQMSGFQTQFNDLYSQGNDLFNQAKSFDLTTDANTIKDYRSQIDNSLQSYNTLANSYSQLERPDFQTNFNGMTHNGTYIPAMASVEAPALSSGLSDYQINTMNDGFENALAHLDKLDSDRTAEQNRISGFQTDFRNNLNSMNNALSGYGIADIDQINSLSRALDQQKQQLGDFTSPLSTDFSYSNGLIGDMDTQIASLRDSYNTEQTRISDFQNTLNTSAGNWADTLASLDITHGDQITGLNTDIEHLIGQASAFKSDLATDFDLDSLYDANRTVDDLQAARDNELARIASTEAKATDTYNWLNNTAASNKGYSLSQIEAMQKQLDDQRGSLTGFSSLLDHDLSDELAGLDTAQTALDELGNRRSTAIDALFSDQSGLLSELNAVDLSNESGIRDLQNRIRLLQQQGNQYSGGRASDLNTQLGDLYTASGDKLTELYNYRGDLESQAQELLNANQDVDFLDLNQL